MHFYLSISAEGTIRTIAEGKGRVSLEMGPRDSSAAFTESESGMAALKL